MSSHYYTVFAVLAFIFGSCAGSFTNVLIYRIPKGISVVKGRSFCPYCKRKIRFYDNIPMLSWLLLRGRCRDCKEKISFRYFFVEFCSAILWCASWLCFANESVIYAVIGMLFCTAVLTVIFTDFDKCFVPDRIIVFIAICGVVLCLSDRFTNVYSRLFGMLFCFLFFGGSYLGSKILLKREGLGLGDVKFMTVAGLCIGLKSSFFSTLVSCVAAALVLSILSAINKNTGKREYPFIPFLGSGCIVGYFYGERLVELYLSLFIGG